MRGSWRKEMRHHDRIRFIGIERARSFPADLHGLDRVARNRGVAPAPTTRRLRRYPY